MPVHPALFFYTSAFLLGIVAGMRSMLPPAFLALTLSRRPELAPAIAPIQWFVSRSIATILGLGALGELVVDKLPQTPNRIALGPFMARVVSGALTGAALVQIGQVNMWAGAACGGFGAILGTLGAFRARRSAGRVTSMRDPFIGGIEDVIAITIAATVIAMLVA